MLPLRYLPWALSIALATASITAAWLVHPGWWFAAALFAPMAAVGLYDMVQKKRTLSRNYPLLIHFRYGLETIGPEFRQYFIEADHDEVPFSREQRSLVYQRAKNVLDKKPFGTKLNVYAIDYEWVNHSITPSPVPDPDFRLTIGAGRNRPYDASVFNISAMSFGSLSPNAIRALNAGAAKGRFYHDTGEGGISRYHLEYGGDLVWEIGSGYFGCRDRNGRFDEARFADQARFEAVRMIEIKLSQGAKPGQGGILPAAKVNAEVAEARGVPSGEDVYSPAAHSAFSTPRELLHFIERLRERSGGKPVGFKLAIGHPWEWFAIVKAILDEDILPDFIVVDGAEGGTGAAPLEFVNRVGVPLRDGLLLVHSTLMGAGLRDRIRVGAAGKITSGFLVARTLALGADWCNAARAFMFALGCIQALNCHTDRCPSGVATQERRRWRKLDVDDKALRVYHFHRNTLQSLAGMLSAAGLESPDQIRPAHIIRRVSAHEVHSYEELFPLLAPGELLDHTPEHEVFRRFWPDATPDSFAAPGLRT